jgi:CheY-like chemotaxis protein
MVEERDIYLILLVLIEESGGGGLCMSEMVNSVLIVDDNRLPRMMERAMLAEHFPEISVFEAVSGEEALEVVRNQSIDLALVDINMPGMDGLELAQRIREESLVSQICFITANIQQYVKEQAAQLGARFIEKPISEEKLISLLQELEAENE